MSELRFFADGHGQALKGLKPELEAIRLSIKKEIQSQFASDMAVAGFFKRIYLHLQMKLELKRRIAPIARQIKAKAPPDALYLNKKNHHDQ